MEAIHAIAPPGRLVRKYNCPGPRYTSYPTAPHFGSDFGPGDFLAEVERSPIGSSDALSLYVHVPFCRRLCHYCACHMIVTHRPEKVACYLDHLEKEVELVSNHAELGRPVVQVHWGGGTPTYLSPDQIERLMSVIRARFDVQPDAEISIEADPRDLTDEHFDAARRAGFNRISFGVQDFDPDVQKAINRLQPVELVERATRKSREVGFESISYDLIYGLPHQTAASFERTLDQVLALGPDRISVFSYAHVPWMKKHQRLIPDAILPDPESKLEIFLLAVDRLTREDDYEYIGMDHFARPGDSLTRARNEGTLQRNFQGYSTHAGGEIYGFGLSAISQTAGAYAQNELDLRSYYAATSEGRPATARGYRLTADDQLRRHVIMELMCRGKVFPNEIEKQFEIDFRVYFADALAALEPMEHDNLVVRTNDQIQVTDLGRFFLRNIVMPFDKYLREATPSVEPRYSQTV
ncbi:oxygen-independent coproporphyrinogen III oxidase [soil metagenome]